MKKIFIFAVPFVLIASLIFYSYKESVLYSSSDKIDPEVTINEKNNVTALPER
ncbi:MAG: hypothetical protein IPL53_10850 [Ignavibacteria bacterium]|nr:hypothetical protein [Ignavibacteria bacterium]